MKTVRELRHEIRFLRGQLDAARETIAEREAEIEKVRRAMNDLLGFLRDQQEKER